VFLTETIEKYLEEQKDRMVKLDEKENVAIPSPARDRKTGRTLSVQEVLYGNTIDWLKGKEAHEALGMEFMRLDKQLTETDFTLSSDAPTFTTQMLPIVRRIYSRMISIDLVSTQPMTGPTGYIYYLDKTYGDTDGTSGITSGDRMDQKTPTNYVRSSEQGTIREISMKLTRKLIEAGTDKLKADWTLEADQDWKSQYKVDIEGELVPDLADEIRRELDRKILDALIAGVAHTVTWNPTGYLAGDTDSVSRAAYRSTIYDTLADAKAWIMENKVLDRIDVDWWLVMSPTTWARFEKLENHNIAPISIDRTTAVGRRFEGVIDNRWKVYISNYIDDNKILVGIKGGWKYAVGYYAPYIPMYTSPRYIVSDDFTQYARGAMSRYAYGVIPETSTGTTNNGLVLINLASS